MDKEDSDSESKYNYSNKKNKELDQSPSPVHVEKKVNISLNPNVTNSPKKINKPIKKVDLGAAANFGKEASLSPAAIITGTCRYQFCFVNLEKRIKRSVSANNLLNDDFDPRAGENNESKNANEFGDFETAFGNSGSTAQTVRSNDGFADFSAAFSVNQNNSQYSTLPNLMSNVPNVLPNVVPPPNMSSTVPNLLTGGMSQPVMSVNSPPLGSSSLISGPSAQTVTSKNNSDLLGDLSNFGSLTVQSQTSNFGISSNNNLLSTNSDLLDSLSTGRM